MTARSRNEKTHVTGPIAYSSPTCRLPHPQSPGSRGLPIAARHVEPTASAERERPAGDMTVRPGLAWLTLVGLRDYIWVVN
jgi:hypothetical protein